MIELSFTNEELDALKIYMNEKYEAINQMLVSNCETDIALLSDESENKIVHLSYDRESVIENLKNIKLIYTLILKQFYKKRTIEKDFFRGTNLSEFERLKVELYIDRLLTATNVEKDADNIYSANWNRPVRINFHLESNIPYIFVNDILKNRKNENEIIIAPFTKIKNISEDTERTIESNSKPLKIYNIELEKQELDELTDNERKGLYNYILDNAYLINKKIEECIKLENENTINFENIRKLEQLLSKYENSIEEKELAKEYSDIDREADYDDVKRINKELDELKNISTNLFEIKKQNINFVNMWKRNIAVYMIAECKEIEKLFENMELPANQIEEPKKEIEKVADNKNNVKNNKNDLDNTIVFEKATSEIVKEPIKSKDILLERVSKEADENIDAAEILFDNINKLISKQQNHAKIAGNMGASYSALNNAFDMRKVAETLLTLLKNIKLKVTYLGEQERNIEIENKLNKISKNCIEISTLINYLNNPKIAVRNSKITRFDELAIIEENELKRKISEKIRDICGEAELKKLKDDLEIIEDKGTFSRILGLFTGRNKLDDFMIEQIEIRQRAIRKTLSKKLSLAHNYSIHELMAEITMFVDENEDDELVEDDVTDLRALAAELRRNYIILESKVQSIVEEKDGRNLPMENRKMTKREIIEVETYRFLNKYGYDISDNEKEEPEYQDTMAKEIGRIVEYINSSNIL